jgi:hypothetical protein
MFAVQMASRGKNEGNGSLSTDNFKNASANFSVDLSFLFMSIIIHGTWPV